jgi:ribosomal protein S18 acetylase RimI-like enzyme
MSATLTIRTLLPSEWKRYRAVRLRALSESPDAFGSTLKAEQERPDDAWKARLSAAATSEDDYPLIAEQGGETVGLVWAKVAAADRSAIDIFQMWVAPEFRRQGIGAELLGAAISWARARGARCVQLSVTCGDTSAVKLYSSHGFKPCGPVEALRPGSELACQPMRLLLGQTAEPSADA